MEVALFVGLQGSGKSTFYRTHFSSTHAHISKDLFRNNRKPQRRQMHLIEEALREGRSVVVDNTNPTIHDRAPIIALARDLGATVTGYFFESRVDDCLVRNRGREGKQRVPDAAIHITRKRLQEPTPEEGFDRLFRVSLTSDGGFSVKDWSEEQGET